MLPACRTEGKEETPPSFALAHGDVEGFLRELRGFHEAFRECFTRREPREHFFRYMVGQLSPLERKSIEPIALEVDGGNVRGMQRLMISGTRRRCAASTTSWSMTIWGTPMGW